MKQNNGGPAFPQHGYESQDEKHWNSEECGGTGLTLRDYFAAKVLAGRSAIPGTIDPDYEGKIAYQLADAMLAARDA